MKLSKRHIFCVMWGRFFPVLLALAAMAGPLTGCHDAQNPETAADKWYPIRGVIVSTDTDKGEVLLKHEAIAGFMEAMTMSYKLKDPTIISELHAGDVITATLMTKPPPSSTNASSASF